MSKNSRVDKPGNCVSEWFGHRVYPLVVPSAEGLADQQSERCPFLSAATLESRKCIKAEASKGVCTISTPATEGRKDWLVCPYRAISPEMIAAAIRQLFGAPTGTDPHAAPAISLMKDPVRIDLTERLRSGQPVFVYFDAKMSGELSIPPTERSPEFAFDVTIIELVLENGQPHIGRFGILEIQTMDFHGSYRAAVRNLRDGLRLHPTNFPETLQAHPNWLAEGIEGPNIANVFKRTFYQMMFKFQLGAHDRCAGCVLAIPQSVWDSWQRHLGAPTLNPLGGSVYRLTAPGHALADPAPATILVFEPDGTADVTPSPIRILKVVKTDVEAMSYWALDVAPKAALANIDSSNGMLSLLARRLKALWPELAKTLTI